MTKMNQVEPDGWEVDEHGKRFRRVAGTIEYEPEILVHGSYVPVSQAENFRAEAENAEHRKNEVIRRIREERKKPKSNCPFSNGMNTACRAVFLMPKIA